MPKIKTAYLLALLALWGAPKCALGHFPWLMVDDENRPRLFFGEGIVDREYHLPESIAEAEVWQTNIDAPAKPIEMEEHEEDGFYGLLAKSPIEARGRLQTSILYGVYHGSKLHYYAQHYPGSRPQAWPREKAKDLDLQTLLSHDDQGLKVAVLWKGEPLAGARVALSRQDGEEGGQTATDENGVAKFAADDLGEGLHGLLIMHVDKSDQGAVDDEEYQSAMHVLTATFKNDPGDGEGSDEAAASPAPGESDSAALPPLPEAIASFGAAAADGWLYVYSGHIGTAHDHSRENLSKHFRRTRLDGSGQWEELPMGPPLQGLALVAHGGKIYRVGGLDARNARSDDEDMHSVDSFACFDPATKSWTEMPSLPNGRSSHNAAVIGDTIYVVGGWQLSGDSDGEWQPGAIAFDLDKPDSEWRELPEPPFRRRALAVSHV
ncbi:MAG: hypothetical protein AAF961_07660, partial [Planctomycetota bacterium]